MRKNVLLSIIISLFLIPGSCKKVPICACGVENPQENLSWLKTYLESTFSIDVYKVTFENIEYIVVDFPSSFDSAPIVYNCQGKKLCEYMVGGICNLSDPQSFWEYFDKNKTLIYKVRGDPN